MTFFVYSSRHLLAWIRYSATPHKRLSQWALIRSRIHLRKLTWPSTTECGRDGHRCCLLGQWRAALSGSRNGNSLFDCGEPDHSSSTEEHQSHDSTAPLDRSPAAALHVMHGSVSWCCRWRMVGLLRRLVVLARGTPCIQSEHQTRDGLSSALSAAANQVRAAVSAKGSFKRQHKRASQTPHEHQPSSIWGRWRFNVGKKEESCIEQTQSVKNGRVASEVQRRCVCAQAI